MTIRFGDRDLMKWETWIFPDFVDEVMGEE